MSCCHLREIESPIAIQAVTLTMHNGCSERSLAVLKLTMHQFNLIVAILGKIQ